MFGYYSSIPANTTAQRRWPDSPPTYREHNNELGSSDIPLSDMRYASTAHSPLVVTSPAPRRPVIHRQRRFMDYNTAVLLFMVWIFLLLSSIWLLGMVDIAIIMVSSDGVTVPGEDVGLTIAISSAPILIATILNEVLFERCWRRVHYSALGKKIRQLSDDEMARNLRAANFEWLEFLKRLLTLQVSGREFRSLLTYGLLRWGTAISIASVQLCVTWIQGESNTESTYYAVKKRHIWLVAPVVLHAASIFGAMLIWMMPPWRFFSDRFNDQGLLKKYNAYFERVNGGSIASYKEVAAHLERPDIPWRTLAKKHRPGSQVRAKLFGISFGLIAMYLPPVAAGLFFGFANHRDVLADGKCRFLFHFVFLAQNILYVFALDFAMWNVSMEGFCKRNGARPNRSLRHLGYSSGIMVFFKAVRQRRPFRAMLFTWVFLIQASLVRCLTVLYTLCITVLAYGTYTDRADFYDPYFWIGWVLMTTFFVFPPFLVWLMTTSEVPVCSQDGWRWAKIAQDGMNGPGFYGVLDGRAVWDIDAQSFTDHAGEELM